MAHEDVKSYILEPERKAASDQSDHQSEQHEKLISEYHDWILTSKPPSANFLPRVHTEAIGRLRQLPSDDKKRILIRLAYGKIYDLYKDAPWYRGTWTDCLWDLSLQQMALEQDPRVRKSMQLSARLWCSEAADRNPGVGRFHYGLAELAPTKLDKLFHCSKSVCSNEYSQSGEVLLATCLDEVLDEQDPFYSAYLKAHQQLFKKESTELCVESIERAWALLDSNLSGTTHKFLREGSHITIFNICAMLEYGSSRDLRSPSLRDEARMLAYGFLITALQHDDPRALPLILVMLVFMFYVTRLDRCDAVHSLEANFPWQHLIELQNSWLTSYPILDTIKGIEFAEHCHLFPEDFDMRGLVFTAEYYQQWAQFPDYSRRDEENGIDDAIAHRRRKRILGLVHDIAQRGRWIHYDSEKREFSLITDDQHLHETT